MWWRLSAAPVSGQRVLHRVEALTRGAVADRVKVHLEAARVELGDGDLQQPRLHKRDAGVRARVPVPVLIRRQHRGSEVLGNAVLHDLDARGGEAAATQGCPTLHQVRDLLQPALTVPPQGAHHAGGQAPVAGGGCVRGTGIAHVAVVADDGVLPRRDAERTQVVLGEQQRAHALVHRGDGKQRADERHRPLVQRSRRRAVRVPLDAAVARVWSGGGDAR